MSKSIKSLVSLAIATALLFALSIPALASTTYEVLVAHDYDGTYEAEDGSTLKISSFYNREQKEQEFNLNGKVTEGAHLGESWKSYESSDGSWKPVVVRSADGKITFSDYQFLFSCTHGTDGMWMEPVGYDLTEETFLLINKNNSDTSFYLVKEDQAKNKSDKSTLLVNILKTYKLKEKAVTEATPTASKVTVDGTLVSFDAYNIDGNNYFKLRDLAKALNGTKKQFEVTWDVETSYISITSGKAYTSVGGELVAGNGKSAPFKAIIQNIYIDTAQTSFHYYNINGNNYLKLRDLGKALNFGVTWDGATNTISINTASAYSE